MIRTEVLEKNTSDFRLEYRENVPDQALIDDIVSYLGEYRFSLPKYSYALRFSGGKLRDPHRGDPMSDLSQRAIGKKILEGNTCSREWAEKWGFENLDSQLVSAKENDTIVWASPPGPKEEGYGNYGFIFVGKVEKGYLSEKTIHMTAIRVENPKIEQLNEAMYLITGKKTDYGNAEEFLKNPKVLSEDLKESYIDALLKRCFSFKANEENQEKFRSIMREMFPLFLEFIQSAKNPRKTQGEKRKEFNSLENYALKRKGEYNRVPFGRESIIIDFRPIPRLSSITGKYGYEPPKVAGSCPSSNKNSNLFSEGSFLNDLFSEQEWFHCPKCNYQADGPIGDTCPNCKLTKEEYAQETGINCD